MSEVVIENSGFCTEGFADIRPALYADNARVKEFSDEMMWTNDRLTQRAEEYDTFLKRTDLMPRARADAERVNAHLLFEMMYRLSESLENRYA